MLFFVLQFYFWNSINLLNFLIFNFNFHSTAYQIDLCNLPDLLPYYDDVTGVFYVCTYDIYITYCRDFQFQFWFHLLSIASRYNFRDVLLYDDVILECVPISITNTIYRVIFGSFITSSFHLINIYLGTFSLWLFPSYGIAPFWI